MRRQQISDGKIYPNTKDHHRHFKEGQYSLNIPPHHYNCRPCESRGHYNSRRNVEWRLAGRIKSVMAPDPVPTQTILGNFPKMHPSNILNTRPTIPTISLQCQPRQTTRVLVLGSKEHMVSMLQIKTQSVPETNRRHNNNRTIAIQDKGILSLRSLWTATQLHTNKLEKTFGCNAQQTYHS
jgi:hypothetical protein